MSAAQSRDFQVFLNAMELEGKAVLSCAQRLSTDEEKRAVLRALDLLSDALARGGKIVVTGLGKSGKVGQKIAATLCSTGSLAVFLHPTEGLHGDLGVVTRQDVVLALSYTGNTEELIRLVPSIRALGVGVVAIGGNRSSQLAALADVWIDGAVAQEACPHNLAPTASTTLALAIGDAFAMALMNRRGIDSAAFAANHPGGTLGRRLSLRVGDIMHRTELLPLVGSDASMDEVVVLSTDKKLGAVLVVDPVGQLLGIVTDGDLRRALRHRERFFALKASDVMTRQPIVTVPEAMAQQALELMENRASQINVLPVVEPQGRVVGLVRLHDLIRSL